MTVKDIIDEINGTKNAIRFLNSMEEDCAEHLIDKFNTVIYILNNHIDLLENLEVKTK